jgi:3-phenylpropionate/trans-cinnamate dioxygenase ferredoxin reductase subunit
VANYASAYAGTNARVRLESVPNSIEHARIVAADITGSQVPASAVPWFWSNQYDARLQTAGLLSGYDQAIVRGVPSSGKFSVAYLLDGVLIALDAINQVKDFVQAKSLIQGRVRMDEDHLSDVSTDLASATATVELVRS